MLRFPSVPWFEELRTIANANPERLRRLGTVDLVLTVKIDFPGRSQLFEITFNGYRCSGVREIPALSAVAPPEAIVLEGPYQAWREMIENIQAHGAADLRHTLNTLAIYDTPMRVTAGSQLDADLFSRYVQNLQEFFDNAAKITTYFAENDQPQATA
ncbi:MAG: hypothetical protein ACREQI_15105 [Candidatus Binataceae bacterium]